MLVPIEKIIVKDRIRKDFGDIEELAQDIEENGLINPPVVMPEQDGTYTLLAGERRLRAMKQLGYRQVEVRAWKTLTEEEKLNIEISENEVRKEFSKAERVEYGRRLERIEAAKAEKRMKSGAKNPVQNSAQGSATRDIVSDQLGISHDTYIREKTIVDNRNLISVEDFENWDLGKLSTNKAYQKIRAELDRQKAENERLRNRPPEIRTMVKEVKVVPDDYESIKREAKQLNAEYQRMNDKWSKARDELQESRKRESELISELEKQKSGQADESVEYVVKSALMFNAGIANFIEKYGGYIWLTEHLDELPEKERKGFLSGINALNAWTCQMIQNLGG